MKQHKYTPINSTKERAERKKRAILLGVVILLGGNIIVAIIGIAIYLFADSLMKDRSRDLPRNKRLDLDLEYSSNKSVLGAQKSAEPLKAPWIKKFFTDTIPDLFTRIIPNILRSSSKHCGRSEHPIFLQYSPSNDYCPPILHHTKCFAAPQIKCLVLGNIKQLSENILMKNDEKILVYCALNTKNVEKIPTELQFSNKIGCCSHPEFLKLPNNC